jgi:hypothetical protein
MPRGTKTSTTRPRDEGMSAGQLAGIAASLHKRRRPRVKTARDKQEPSRMAIQKGSTDRNLVPEVNGGRSRQRRA